mmetsp:Transcript_33169/g.69076  ORF Transcript_33169/g.69076 Transcript_33169/m.69076 type:complete len:284 (-) Transcript_33169:3352-4203(-)
MSQASGNGVPALWARDCKSSLSVVSSLTSTIEINNESGSSLSQSIMIGSCDDVLAAVDPTSFFHSACHALSFSMHFESLHVPSFNANKTLISGPFIDITTDESPICEWSAQVAVGWQHETFERSHKDSELFSNCSTSSSSKLRSSFSNFLCNSPIAIKHTMKSLYSLSSSTATESTKPLMPDDGWLSLASTMWIGCEWSLQMRGFKHLHKKSVTLEELFPSSGLKLNLDSGRLSMMSDIFFLYNSTEVFVFGRLNAVENLCSVDRSSIGTKRRAAPGLSSRIA